MALLAAITGPAHGPRRCFAAGEPARQTPPPCAPPQQVTDHSQEPCSASVSHASHAGGFLAGLLLAAALLPGFKGRRAVRVEALLSNHGVAAAGRLGHARCCIALCEH